MTGTGAYTEVKWKKNELYVKVSGEIDHHSARSVRKEIDRALFQYRPTALRIELSEVGFMDSSGLGLILGRVAEAEEIGCHVYLYEIPRQVNRIFEMAGIRRIPNLSLVSLKKEES